MATYSSILAGKNPMDRGAWWALVHGVPKSQTGLYTLTTKMNVLGPSWAQKGFPPCSGLFHLGLVVICGRCCFCSVSQLCPTLWDPMDCSTPGFPVPHYLPELAQTHVHWVDDAIQPSPPAFNLSQHQSLFQWVGSSHQVAKVLELQLQFFPWIFKVDVF